MTWQQPFALAGLLAVALPILIHLLGRGRARTVPFPSLRFVPASRPLPTRRTQLHDLLLLGVRVAVVALAAAALAQPLWRTAGRKREFKSSLARAIIVDTSASMHRVGGSAGARSTLDSARRVASALVTEANVSAVVETASPSSAIRGAVDWLARQRQRGELVVVSDFQRGAVVERDIGRLPSFVGIRLVRVGAATAPGDVERTSAFGSRVVTARTARAASDAMRGVPTNDASPDAREHRWSETTVEHGDDSTAVRVVAGVAELRSTSSALAAARTVSRNVAPPADSSRSAAIVIVTSKAAERATLARSAVAPYSPDALRLAILLQEDADLHDVAGSAPLVVTDSAVGIPLVRDANGRAAVSAAEAVVNGQRALVLFAGWDPASVAFATLVAAAREAAVPQLVISEFDLQFVSDSALARWQRPPSNSMPGETAGSPPSVETPVAGLDAARGESDARWLWVGVLGLLVLEWWLRRPRGPDTLSHVVV